MEKTEATKKVSLSERFKKKPVEEIEQQEQSKIPMIANYPDLILGELFAIRLTLEKVLVRLEDLE